MLRRRDRVLLLAALTVALTVPLGFVLSVPSSPTPPVERRADAIASAVVWPGRFQSTSLDVVSPSRPLLKSAKFIAVGSLLMGFAAIARRT